MAKLKYRYQAGKNRFMTLVEASDHAGKIFRKSGIVVAIESLPLPKPTR